MMANKTVEQILFDLDDHRMKRNKHFELFDGPEQFIRFKKRGIGKIIVSKFYSRFMDVVGKLRPKVDADESAIDQFVNRLLTTRPMRHLRNNVFHLSRSKFKKWFMRTWFQDLSTEPNDCLFKHVFCGNFKHVFRGNKRVKGRFDGCHNWIEIAVYEHSRFIEYEEPHRIISATATDESALLAESRFKIRAGNQYYHKHLNTVFVGTSPAFDLALYSLIFKNNERLAQSQCNQAQFQHYRDRDARRYKACINGIVFDVIFNYRDRKPSSVYPERE